MLFRSIVSSFSLQDSKISSINVLILTMTLMILNEIIDNIYSFLQAIAKLIILFQIHIFLDFLEELVFESLVIDENADVVHSVN